MSAAFMSDKKLAANEALIFKLLEAAANRGEACPSNALLASHMGFASKSGPVKVMKNLERAGMISVQRYQRDRVVCITSTNKRTATPVKPTKHWRGLS